MEKDSYAQYLSYATLVSCVAHLGAMLFQFPGRDFFLQILQFVGEKSDFYQKCGEICSKYLSTVIEIK